MREPDFDDTACYFCGLSLDDDNAHELFAANGFCSPKCFAADRAKQPPIPLVRPLLEMLSEDLLGHDQAALKYHPDTLESIFRHAVCKGTTCGAWLAIMDPVTIQLGSIVEGCDFGTETHVLVWPFTSAAFWEALDEIEGEAAWIWDQTHGCEDCGIEGEWGHPAINLNCKTCKGQGAII